MKANHHERHSRRTAAEAQLRAEALVDIRENLRDGAVQAVSAEASDSAQAGTARSGVSAVSLAHKSPPLRDGGSSERAATSANPRSSAEAVAGSSPANPLTFMLNYIDAVTFGNLGM